MRRPTVTEAKNRLSARLAEVRAGETILIVDRGIPVARLEPVAARSDDEGRIARLVRAGVLIPAQAEPPRPATGGSVLEALLEERREGH